MNFKIYILLAAQNIMLFISGFMNVWSCTKTVQSHAGTLGNLHGPMTVIGTILTCGPVTKN